MTLENMRYLLEINNREILNRIQSLKIMLDVIMEAGIGGGSGSVNSEEIEELEKQLEEINTKIQNLDIKDENICIKIDKIIQDMDSLQIDISQKEGNAIKQEKDGIYVADKTDDIESVNAKVNVINKFKKYVDNELDYFNAMCIEEADTTVSFSKGIVSLANFTCITKNMEITNDTYVLLKANKTYNIKVNFSLTNTSGRYLYVVTDSGTRIGSGRSGSANYNPTIIDFIYTPIEDTNIGLSFENTATTYLNACYFSIHEIGHEIVIDPVEYVNDTQGLEDTPVGHILTYIGVNIPKHYLACDGSEYNIFDYPYLAEHVLNEFGSYNYFGGDGATTFAVPNLNTKESNEKLINHTDISISMIENTTKDVSHFLEPNVNEQNYVVFDMPHTYEISFLEPKKVCKYGLLCRVWDHNDTVIMPKDFEIQAYNQLTKEWVTLDTQTNQTYQREVTNYYSIENPNYYSKYRLYITSNNGTGSSLTNYIQIGYISFYEFESVLIDTIKCIKYEPTYFMAVDGTSGLYSDEEVETAIADTIKILGETTSDEEIQLAITDTIKILNEEVIS